MRRFPYNKLDGISNFEIFPNQKYLYQLESSLILPPFVGRVQPAEQNDLYQYFLLCAFLIIYHINLARTIALADPDLCCIKTNFTWRLNPLVPMFCTVKVRYQIHTIKSIWKFHFCFVVSCCGFFCFVHSRCYEPSIY